MINWRAVSAVLLLFAAQSSWGQADPQTVGKIVDEGKNHNQIMSHLDYLTHKIGPRLTASPKLDKAYEWTQKKFKEFGCKNVHLEEWGEYNVGFDRGKKQIARMVLPDKMEFEFTTPSWTPGTKGLVRGLAVAEPTTMEEFEKVKYKLKGAWVISKRTGFGRRNAEPTDVEKAVQSAEIAGYVSASRSELVVTFGNHVITWDKLPTEVRVIIRKLDMDAIQERLTAGKEVVLEIQADNKFIKGPRKNYNVIAEIPGTEKPDEVVIISGHLDSWDGPGSQGAQDNGTGTCVTLEAARILCKTGAKPKRTVRFILWTGEEQGLFGSVDYVKKHKSELDKISAVFVDDGGTNYEGGLTCTPEMEPLFKEAFKPAMDAFPDMPMVIRTQARVPRFGGSDHFPFQQAEVPAFFWMETGRGNYGHVHHTQFDRYETAIPEYLVQSSTNSAATAYVLACAPKMLPREAKTATTAAGNP
jgi:carboxypeptidase Q